MLDQALFVSSTSVPVLGCLLLLRVRRMMNRDRSGHKAPSIVVNRYGGKTG